MLTYKQHKNQFTHYAGGYGYDQGLHYQGMDTHLGTVVVLWEVLGVGREQVDGGSPAVVGGGDHVSSSVRGIG